MNARSICLEAIKIANPGEREAYLNHACGENLELRQRVNRLLAAGEVTGEYIPLTEQPGTRVGQYKLLNQIGLGLLVSVCQAIQHTHMKWIIHWDIKLSNLLVTMCEDKPVPKGIDFGVAKAAEQGLTEKTMFTQYGTPVGSFEYMSPEQAKINAFDIDTRSDVYSLGVLLYVLLTGSTPLDRKVLRQAALGELIRMITIVYDW